MSSERKNLHTSYGPLSDLAHFSAKHPYAVLFVAIVLAILSAVYTENSLDFKTNRNDLVAGDEPAVERFSEISDDFGRLTNAVVVVEGNDLDRMKSFISDLAERLLAEPEYFDSLLYKLDISSLEGKKLLYLSEKELLDLKQKLSDYDELIEELAFTPRLSQIFSYINQRISEATVSYIVSGLLGGESSEGETAAPESDGSVEEKDPVDLSFLRSLLTEMRLALGADYRFHSPWDTFFKASAKFSEDGYLVSDDHRFAFMTLNARSEKGTFTKKRAALNRLRGHVQALLQERYPELQAGVTGGSALADDEMSQAMKDSALAGVLAFIGCGLLFMVSFRQIYNPLLVLTSLALATAWTFGWLTLTVGHLTVLSVAFMSIVFGLGIDFGIHLVARYTEERAHGLNHDQSMENAYRFTGRAILAGGLTTAAAFYAVMLADFRGIQELGFIAGSGVILAMLATFTVLPALLSLVRKRMDRLDRNRLQLKTRISFLETFYRHPGWILGLFVLISIFSLVGYSRVSFDYNLLNLQAKGTESVVWEKKISERGDRSSWFAVTTAATLEEARRKEDAFKSLPSVKKVDSMADLIPKDQEVRIQKVLELRPLVPDFEIDLQEPEPLDAAEIMDLLEKIQFKLRSDTEWDPQKKPDEMEIQLTRQALLDLIHEWRRFDAETVRSHLEPFQEKLFNDFAGKFDLLRNNVNPPGPVRLEDVPDGFRSRFQGKSGQYLVQIFSRENIWEREHMETFVEELRTVDPHVTGPPVVGHIAANLMQKGYLQAGFYAFIANFVVLGWAFRRAKDVCLALVPLTFTLFLSAGLMGWIGVAFNLANLLGLPMVIGTADDYGVHIVHRFRENPHSEETLVSGSTARAINLASWTTMIGFASLMVAKHYGVFSLGLFVTLAMAVTWVLALFVLPVVLIHIVGKREMRAKQEAVRIMEQ